MPLILPPSSSPNSRPKQEHKFPARIGNMQERARFWHDYAYPGDVARAIVTAQRQGKPLPVTMPEQCPNRDCRVCHPSKEDQDKLDRKTR